MMRNFSGNQSHLRRLWLPGLVAVVLLASVFNQPLAAQESAYGGQSTRHYLYDYGMPPGMVAHRKMLAREAMQGYFQPIQFVGPEGCEISVFSEGLFQPVEPGAAVAGLLVGHIYRLRITGIPGHPGKEMYPSVEIIGRLFPPQGQEVKCAIPVHIPMDDLQPAMDGRLVTRVVYLENPRTAIPEQRTPADQPFFDVGLTEDPIRVAEKFGRPMVIVRIGSRVPDQEELDGFGFGTPPLMWFESAMNTPAPHNDPFNNDPLETLPPGVPNDSALDVNGYSVQQVAWLEPIDSEEPQEPAPAPRVAGPARPVADWVPHKKTEQPPQPAPPAVQTPANPIPAPQTSVQPTPDQAPSVDSAVDPVPQSWSLDDKGVQNNTGLEDGIVLAARMDAAPVWRPIPSRRKPRTRFKFLNKSRRRRWCRKS